MTEKASFTCAWQERVSAFLDNELSANEKPMVQAHLKSCASCQALTSIPDSKDVRGVTSSATISNTFLNLIPERPSPLIRIALLLVGVFIVVNSAPEFIRGNTRGDALHDLRHLAIWQVAIGLAVVTSAFTFRISRVLTVILATFLSLTAVATLYDLVTGHRGPWTDEMHIFEAFAVVLILRLIWPQLHFLSHLERRKSGATQPNQ